MKALRKKYFFGSMLTLVIIIPPALTNTAKKMSDIQERAQNIQQIQSVLSILNSIASEVSAVASTVEKQGRSISRLERRVSKIENTCKACPKNGQPKDYDTIRSQVIINKNEITFIQASIVGVHIRMDHLNKTLPQDIKEAMLEDLDEGSGDNDEGSGDDEDAIPIQEVQADIQELQQHVTFLNETLQKFCFDNGTGVIIATDDNENTSESIEDHEEDLGDKQTPKDDELCTLRHSEAVLTLGFLSAISHSPICEGLHPIMAGFNIKWMSEKSRGSVLSETYRIKSEFRCCSSSTRPCSNPFNGKGYCVFKMTVKKVHFYLEHPVFTHVK